MGIIGIFVIGIAFFYPQPPSYEFSNLREGTISDREIIAPFTFDVYKSKEELIKEREEARRRIPPYFWEDERIASQQLSKLKAFWKDILTINGQAEPDSTKLKNIQALIEKSGIVLFPDHSVFFLLPSDKKVSGRAARKAKGTTVGSEYLRRKEQLQRYTQTLYKIASEVYRAGILDVPKESLYAPQNKIIVRVRGKEIERDVNSCFDVAGARNWVFNALKAKFQDVGDSLKIGYAVLTPFLVPNIFFDREKTEDQIQKAVSSVPTVKGRIYEGERIIDSHERVTKEHVEILESLARARAERELEDQGFSVLFNYIGRVIFTLLALIPLMTFLLFYRPHIFWDDRLIFMIFITMLLILALAFVIREYGLSEYLVPVAILPMVMTLLFDARTGFMGALSLSIIMGGLFGNNFNLVIVLIFVSTGAILCLGLFRHRKRLLNSVAIIGGTYFISIAVFAFLQGTSFSVVGREWLSGIVNGIVSPLFTYGLLLFYESFFDVTSEFKLTELADLNNPLLRMLSLRAPGTYHHSLLVSTLAESAAEAIGANALLAKVGSYYHDIGKMFMPEYFVENQKAGRNPHDKLSPRISSLILSNHVKKGLELADEYKLPSVVKKFILQHHGTGLMKYFYQKALERSNGNPVNEADFRYSGEKPDSKETGIVMLADAVEALARSIREPSAGKIHNAIISVIEERLREGELDRCPLTMQDLHKIAESFETILVGVSHPRIEYPGQEKAILRRELPKIQNQNKVVESSPAAPTKGQGAG